MQVAIGLFADVIREPCPMLLSLPWVSGLSRCSLGWPLGGMCAYDVEEDVLCITLSGSVCSILFSVFCG